MSRLPTRRILASMSDNNRWATLSAFARDLRRELEEATTAQHRRLVRRKLARVSSAADQFGDFIGDVEMGHSPTAEAQEFCR